MSGPSVLTTPSWLLIVAIFTLAACGGVESEPTAVPVKLPPDGPVSWPYIFSGLATVQGEPVPVGIPIFARLGTARSPVTKTLEGNYLNVVVGPLTEEDMNAHISFYLGSPDGDSVESEQSVKFKMPAGPENHRLDLNFARLP